LRQACIEVGRFRRVPRKSSYKIIESSNLH
jgi:hypothetical protein